MRQEVAKPRGISLREILTEMSKDEGLTTDVREECRQALKSLPKRNADPKAGGRCQ